MKIFRAFAILAFVTLILSSARLAMAANPEFDCKTGDFNSGEGNKYKNSRNPGEWMMWKVHNAAGALVTVRFTSKDGGAPDSPFIYKQLSFDDTMKSNPDMLRRGSIDPAPAAEGSYKYEITCTFPDQSIKRIDPIIEVPRRDITEEPPQTQPKP